MTHRAGVSVVPNPEGILTWNDAMTHPAITLIEQRISANMFDPSQTISEAEIETLMRIATRAPTAYNLQNWRFIAVLSRETKAKLRAHAFGQPKVEDAAVTFIICGTLPDAAILPQRLRPSVEAGYMSADTSSAWQAAAGAQYVDPRTARDEAVRSATFAATTLILAAEALGFVSCPMIGFDAEGVARDFALGPEEVPVVLVAVGRAAPGNWPQKPRRPLAEVLEIA